MLKNSFNSGKLTSFVFLLAFALSLGFYQITYANDEKPSSGNFIQASMVVTLQFNGQIGTREEFFLDFGDDSIEKSTTCTASNEWAVNVRITCQYFPEQNWVSVTAINDEATSLPLEVSVLVTNVTHVPVPVFHEEVPLYIPHNE